LFLQYLQRQTEAGASGLWGLAPTGEVLPYEAVSLQPTDPGLAWDEALTAVHLAGPKAEKRACQVPSDWPSLVANHEPVMAVPFCAGNFPQLVRDLKSLVQASKLSDIRPAESAAAQGREGVAATTSAFPQILVTIGALRLAKRFDEALALIGSAEKTAPAGSQDGLANERAAVLWHQGRAKEAADLWRTRAETAPVLFNRGMAALFMDEPAAARPWLTEAVNHIPDKSAWHHLGRLYLALADMHA
jgi:tetratricopeptide (TPR) repeat protein